MTDDVLTISFEVTPEPHWRIWRPGWRPPTKRMRRLCVRNGHRPFEYRKFAAFGTHSWGMMWRPCCPRCGYRGEPMHSTGPFVPIARAES